MKIREEGLDTRVVLLSTYDYQSYAARAVALGVSEYLLKGAGRDEIIRAIHAAAAGEPPKVEDLKVFLARGDQGVNYATGVWHHPTQVLRHIALGLSNREIANSLDISVETVKEHVQNILRKLNVNDRTQAAVWAVRKGLV